MADNFGLKGVKRIVRLTDDGRNTGGSLTIYKPKRRRKKGSAALRPWDKQIRRTLKAQDVFTRSYLDRHERSSRKKRDGWLRDLNYNVLRASARYARALRR